MSRTLRIAFICTLIAARTAGAQNDETAGGTSVIRIEIKLYQFDPDLVPKMAFSKIEHGRLLAAISKLSIGTWLPNSPEGTEDAEDTKASKDAAATDEGVHIMGGMDEFGNEVKFKYTVSEASSLQEQLDEMTQYMTILSTPTIVIREGKQGSISVGERINEYMVKGPDGHFELRDDAGVFAGASFELKVLDVANEAVRIGAEFKLSYLAGRQKIEGTELEIGFPVVKSKTVYSTAYLEEPELLVLGISDASGTGTEFVATIRATIQADRKNLETRK